MRSGLIGFGIILSCFVVHADESVAGGKGTWQVSPVGLGTDNPAAFNPAPRLVAEAIHAAWSSNRPAYYGLWDADSNSPPARVKECFDEWQSYSQRYLYAVIEQAILNDTQSASNALFAISIVPASLRSTTAGEIVTNEPASFRAQVIFVRQAGAQYKLLPATADDAVERVLLSRAEKSLYQPQRNFTQQALLEKSKQFHKQFLGTMETNGQPPEYISSMKERFEVDDTGAVLNNWAAWTNHYKAVQLDPQVSFERRDPVTYDFHELLSAFRSYQYAVFVGDAKTLLAHADESGIRYLKTLHVDLDHPRRTYDITNALTHVTVLLTATTKFEGKDFALVFWRGENEKDPKNGSISLQSTIFVRRGAEYWLTRELSNSYLGNLLDVAHAPGGTWKYSKFEKVMPSSQLPPSFYRIY